MKYRVWCDDYHAGPEEGHVVDAYAGHAAAEEWAQYHDARSAEYWIGNGNEVVVHVRAEGGGPTLDYAVTGRAVPEYTALPVRPNTQQEPQP